jgi:hypothetical protein
MVLEGKCVENDWGLVFYRSGVFQYLLDAMVIRKNGNCDCSERYF